MDRNCDYYSCNEQEHQRPGCQEQIQELLLREDVLGIALGATYAQYGSDDDEAGGTDIVLREAFLQYFHG